jgi:hypothetical protein
MNHTKLSDIPYLDDIESGNPTIQSEHFESPRIPQGGMNTSKFIRQTSGNVVPEESGMIPYNQYASINNNVIPQSQQPQPGNNYYRDLNCVEVSDHIQNCPVCSKFYKQDTSIYMIMIILLSIICILLLKRVLNV